MDNFQESLRQEMTRPSVLYQNALRISRDGDRYCVLMGANLMDGVAGFGSSLLAALHNFDANIEKPI